MNQDAVTLVITSCGRLDLLKETIISFFKFNTYPIEECIVVEDSGKDLDLSFLNLIVPTKLKILINEKNIGQIDSIDRAYSEVTTPYIFHCEDDWEFYKLGFIEKSFKILKADSTVSNVWLRSHADTMGHPIDNTLIKKDNIEYFYMTTNYKGKWHGFSLNPGLRRMSDYLKFKPYAKLDVLVRKKKTMILGEVDLSIHYFQQGYKGAITIDKDGYVRHIGDKRHIPLPWENNYAV
jgi:GT2 family glycosyltransferase